MNVIIILNFNDFETTSDYLNKIKEYKSLNKIIVVDNCSTDKSYDLLLKYQSNKIHVIKSDRNGGYGYGNNYGIRYANELWNNIQNIVISNPDMIIDEKTVKELTTILNENETIGIIAPIIRNLDNTIVSNFIWDIPLYKDMLIENFLFTHKLAKKMKFSIYHNKEEIENKDIIFGGAVPGCFFIVKNSIVKEDCFDERCFLFGEETILGYMIRKKGYKVAVCTKKSAIHMNHVSINKSKEKTKKMDAYLLDSYKIYLKEYLKKDHWMIRIYSFLHKIGRTERKIIGFVLFKMNYKFK